MRNDKESIEARKELWQQQKQKAKRIGFSLIGALLAFLAINATRGSQ